MDESYTMKLSALAAEHNLKVEYAPDGWENIRLSVPDVNRPGLQLIGFYDYFDPRRIQVIGIVETTYLKGISADERRLRFEQLMSQPIPALVCCHGMLPLQECLDMAKKHSVPVFTTGMNTSEFIAALLSTLKVELAPRIARHGVMVEVNGEGILILGESGVGKSETAIELVKRGHIFIADDVVEIKRTSAKTLIGSAPEHIRYFIELRGVGIVDVRRLFGVGAVKPVEKIDMVISLEPWQDDKMYDRLGLDNQYTSILGVKIPSLVLPVKPGRNLAVIIEVAAMNNRQKREGHNAAMELTEQINKHFDESLKG